MVEKEKEKHQGQEKTQKEVFCGSESGVKGMVFQLNQGSLEMAAWESV